MADWLRIEELFLGALDLEPGKRDAYLEAACAGDRELKREVEQMLAVDAPGQTGIFGRSVVAAARELAEDEWGGRQIGPWRIVREIGRGGMGSVYLAARAEEQYQKLVAIKVLRQGMDSTELVGRFRHERQIVAQLDHPYITRLLDGGTLAPNEEQGRNPVSTGSSFPASR